MASAPRGLREAKRAAAHSAIVDAAWRLVEGDGLASLSMRELAAEAGISTPTVYAYFESKHAIYDAMFLRAATDFLEWMTSPSEVTEPDARLVEGTRRFLQFCTSDPLRYQLLFQRPIPGFEPSPEAFEPAVRALEAARERLAATGVHDPRHVDLWTALNTGLADQQIANDPGGSRWVDLADDAVAMFLDHCRAPARSTRAQSRSRRA